jgi:hypothetical protein
MAAITKMTYGTWWILPSQKDYLKSSHSGNQRYLGQEASFALPRNRYCGTI